MGVLDYRAKAKEEQEGLMRLLSRIWDVLACFPYIHCILSALGV